MYILIKTSRSYHGGENYSKSIAAEMEAPTLEEAIILSLNHKNPVGYDVYKKVKPGKSQNPAWCRFVSDLRSYP